MDKRYEEKFLRKFKKKKNYYNFINKNFFIKLCKKNKLKLELLPSLLPNSDQKNFRYSALIKRVD